MWRWPRNLDHLRLRLLDERAIQLARTNASGDPLPLLPGTAWIEVEAESLIRGAQHG